MLYGPIDIYIERKKTKNIPTKEQYPLFFNTTIRKPTLISKSFTFFFYHCLPILLSRKSPYIAKPIFKFVQ